MASVVDELRERARGRVLTPRTDGYEEGRRLWNARIDRAPGAIVRCAGAADVIAGVDVAREADLPLSVRGGGHHVAGHAVCDGGIALDLGPMDGVRVDPDARTARVGPGATVRQLNRETQAFGLATTGAPVTMIGVAGFALGGGLGWTSRSHGLACDNLLSADVVTADGDLVRASEDEHPDLFWGLRGGGGNFGVVTSFEFRLHELGPEVLAGSVVHPADRAAGALRAWRDHMAGAPDRLQCMPVFFRMPDPDAEGAGPTVLALSLVWAGDPAEGEEAVRPLREAGDPLADDVGVVPYAGLLSDLDDMFRAGHRNYYRSAFFDELPDAALDALAEAVAPVPTPFSSAFLEPMGGAIADREPDATAFPHRERSFCVTAVPKWESPERDEEMQRWADGVLDALDPHAEDGVYVNYLDDWGRAPEVRAAYGDHWERLSGLKRRWDPGNLFRGNHNVPPGG